jgi:hypothetical protein
VGPIIIGVGHKKGVGKDAFASRLVDKWGFVRISFADQLKEAARIVYHLTDAQLYGDKKEVVDPRWGKTPRQILQEMGTGIRQFDEDVWIKSTQVKIEKLLPNNNALRVVIADVRFPNEAEALHSWGNIKDFTTRVIKIHREVPENEFSKHISETALDSYAGWDEIVDNTSSLSALFNKADQLMERIVNPKKEIKNALNRRTTENI